MIHQCLELIQLAKSQLLQHSYETKSQANSKKTNTHLLTVFVFNRTAQVHGSKKYV